ncbi:MAG: carbohydrate binding family 9 domain-containing protein [Ignavibacteria bacterium]|nr:carbohydrate binding family 9 domain-containing protein [Ignavibacteria bacterium]
MPRPNFSLLLVLALSLSAVSLAQQKSLRLRAAPSRPVIDGVVDDVWATADSAADFEQLSPYYHKAPAHRTEARVLTTPDALYCLMRCEADPRTVQHPTGKLDDFGGDIVSIMLDTFGDKQTAYKFAVSAGGVRIDCRLLDDARNRDYNWDGVWFAAAKMYDWGFIVEMEIPYRCIQYDESLLQWGLDFDRWVPEGGEDLYWASYEENEGQRISKFGSLLFDGQRPTAHGLNLEIYPVGLQKTTAIREGAYRVEHDAGLDIFYNPSKSLTFQATANPDFAQIEADPFQFSISRYETYFNERRPFFTQGNEVFMAAGREQNSGFYRPLELFYSRRIGKKLPDGSEAPLLFGSKAFGRADDWEYGGFAAIAGETEYETPSGPVVEQRATFVSARVKKQIWENSSVGVLFVGKHDKDNDEGVIDIDGALRGSDWQLAYQLARSYRNNTGDYAASAGYKLEQDKLFLAAKGRAIGNDFDISQVGYVPWKGLADFVALGGPRWYFPEGELRALLLYAGGAVTYEHADLYTDHSALLGMNMSFRSNFGFEINASHGRSRDGDTTYPSTEVTFSSWFNISPKWSANMYGGWQRSFNFRRGYQSYYAWYGVGASWTVFDELQIGTSFDSFIEGRPVANPDKESSIEEVTINTRPFFSLTPVNDLNIYAYIDLVAKRSTDRVEQLLGGLLISYQFLPKSWVYLSINEIRDWRVDSPAGSQTPVERFQMRERAAVLKVKYLYYL